MKTSAGIVITDGKRILLGHVTGSRRYDLPKGGVEDGESVLDAALRETLEEFGIIVPKNELEDLGRFKYLSGKELYLFRWGIKKFPDLSTLNCTSTFKKGKVVKEIDGYKIFDIEDTYDVIAKGLVKVFKKNIPQK